MHTPQQNPTGYDNSSISDMDGLRKNVRFLIMHGVSDDNVHTQNTYTLLDKLDLAGVDNYDVHVFPDSDHSIVFHNANAIVYDSKLYTIAFGLWHGLLTSDFDRAFKVVDKCVQWRMVEDGGPNANSETKHWIKTSLAGTAKFGRLWRSEIYRKLILGKGWKIFCGI